jgi:anti-sigma factor RsiW
MTDRDPVVTADELHAYIDGEIPEDRRAAVEAWLASHPEDAILVDEWRAQADAIRARYGAVASEPVSPRFDINQVGNPGRSWRTMAAIAAMTAFLAGAIAGWVAHRASAAGPSSLEILNSEALSAHRLYIAEVRHPIEVKAAEQHLMPWLSRRVGATLRAPNLESFSLKLLGGRLLPGPIGPAALFMYESPTGERYTLYCSKSMAPRTALRYRPANGVAAIQWIENDIGYVVSGPDDRTRLIEIAQTAYDQMENRGPARSSADQLISRQGS